MGPNMRPEGVDESLKSDLNKKKRREKVPIASNTTQTTSINTAYLRTATGIRNTATVQLEHIQGSTTEKSTNTRSHTHTYEGK